MDVCHALVITDRRAAVELELLVEERHVVHQIAAHAPWQGVGVDGLLIEFTGLVIDTIVDQCVFDQRALDAGHDAGELVGIELAVHEAQVVGERRVQTEVSDGLTHGVGVVAHRLHLGDGRLGGRTAIVEADKLFFAEVVFEVDAWRDVPGIDRGVADIIGIEGVAVGLGGNTFNTDSQVAFLRDPAIVDLELLVIIVVGQMVAIDRVIAVLGAGFGC